MKFSNNKKAFGIGIFGFFFFLMIFVAIYFFGTILMHFILYDYGIGTLENTASSILQANGTAMTNINALATSYLATNSFYDILFLVFIVSAFVESTIAAMKAKEQGFMSFFGFVTIGNIFLIFIMFYAVQIQGWIFNEIIFQILVQTVQTPVMTFFINYGIYVGVTWYLWLLAINQINFEGVKSKFGTLFGRSQERNDQFLDDQLEELER